MSETEVREKRSDLKQSMHLCVYPQQVFLDNAAVVQRFGFDVQRFGKRMFSFMKKSGGIGLAAPQVGVSLRMVCLKVDATKLFLINPSYMPITADSDTKMEGCLSLPGKSYTVTRLYEIEVRAQDATGKPIHFGARDLCARVIQHEVDHLDGVLICHKNINSVRQQGTVLSQGHDNP